MRLVMYVLANQLLLLCLRTTPSRAFKPSFKGHSSRVLRTMSSDAAGLTDIGGIAEVEHTGEANAEISWKARIDTSIARSRKIRGSNFVQISTVSNGEPRCRTVVFRGFQRVPSEHPIAIECDGMSCVMKMITDNRSNKVSEAAAQPFAEIVWWFSKTSEQYRIRGDLCFAGGGDFDSDVDKVLAAARKEQWGNLSDPAREQFFWKEPGTDYSGESIVPLGGRDGEGNLLEAPQSFLLMFLRPKRVEYLRLGDNFRQIDKLIDNQWMKRRVNP
ncbi:Pyridoxamine 5'-phosphate oxidase [Fragilaria crotonensis]|nr:Pyridoxamine 5'-phosphate oxidase [Fragilaria crotonensis]